MDNIIPFKSREVKHCPPHFVKVTVEVEKTNGLHLALADAQGRDSPRSRIRNWCHENVQNRFFIGKTTSESGGFIVEAFVVAFEVESDATYFTLLKQSFLETD